MVVHQDEITKLYYYQTRVTYMDGTVKQKKKRGFRTGKEARQAEALAQAEAKHSMPPGKKLVTTFEDAATEYLEWYAARKKVSSSVKVKSIFKSQLLPHFGKMEIKEITASDVMDFETELIGKYSGRYVSIIHAYLSNFYKYAITKGYVKENAAKIAGGPTVEKPKLMNYWTLEEFQEFIKSVDDRMYYALFTTLYYSGMRKGELRALTWADIDFEASVISVTKTNYKGIVHSPKTPDSYRKIPMPDTVMKMLKKLKMQRDPMPKKDHVVFGEIFDAISETTLSRRYAKYLKASGVKKIRLHDFRHSHASYLMARKVPISVIAARLGHGDIAMTLNVYAHMMPNTEKEAVLVMEDDFKDPAPVKMLPNRYHDAENS